MNTITSCQHCQALITEENTGYVDEDIQECRPCMEFQDDLFELKHGGSIAPDYCPEL